MPDAAPDDGLPYSQAAANNRDPILEQLRRLLAGSASVLEIGAGTGQHALHFAQALPHIHWQPTEHPDAVEMLALRCSGAGLPNLAEPLALDIRTTPWPVQAPGVFYTANTLHIVAWETVELFFTACGEHAGPGTLLITYGPFNYGGRFTSESNERFNGWLRERDPVSGIRDFERVDACAQAAGFSLLEDIAMPANNRLLCWKQEPASSS
ncbi:MAG: DUF938 domain-containing protein [Pseudomonadota bacterium]